MRWGLLLDTRVHGLRKHGKRGDLALLALLLPPLPACLETLSKSAQVNWSAFQLCQVIQKVPRQIVAVLDHIGRQGLLFFAEKGRHRHVNHLSDWILRRLDLQGCRANGGLLDSFKVDNSRRAGCGGRSKVNSVKGGPRGQRSMGVRVHNFSFSNAHARLQSRPPRPHERLHLQEGSPLNPRRGSLHLLKPKKLLKPKGALSSLNPRGLSPP